MAAPDAPPRLLLTPGEPAGIGPDLVIRIAQDAWPAQLVAVADPALLERRARLLGLPLKLLEHSSSAHRPGTLQVHPVALARQEIPGQLDVANAGYVLETLRVAADACLRREAAALVTAPLQKSVINDAGHAFSGHTEFLAERCHARRPVMMLQAGSLRVALATTHLPLRAVADAITGETLRQVIEVLHFDLVTRFGIANPRILVCGLNPHAGESGHLGREEIEIIRPALDELRERGIDLVGPLPADTLFLPKYLETADAVLAMYHDQGLPVLKALGFGEAVNVTLGLPIIRTSVDHGTALDLAGTGRAEAGSLRAAIGLALELAQFASGSV